MMTFQIVIPAHGGDHVAIEYVGKDGKSLYILTVPTDDVWAMRTPSRNTEWHKVRENVGSAMLLAIGTKEECERECSRVIAQRTTRPPHCNANGAVTNRIRCLETGQLFHNAAEAVRVMGLNQGNLSKHLRGKLASVGGFKFEYA